jgi:hypothetical protein
VPLHVLWMRNITKIWSISFIKEGNTQQRVKYYTNYVHYTTLYIHNTIIWKFFEKMFSTNILFFLFCNFYVSKPTSTRTQNREKQRNSLRKKRLKKKKQDCVSQQVWHDKVPSMRKGPAGAPSTGLNFVARWRLHMSKIFLNGAYNSIHVYGYW